MGNTIGPGMGQAVNQDIKTYVTNISDYTHKVTLGVGKIFKTLQCTQEDGETIVKLFIKKDPNLSLKKYEERLQKLHDLFRLHEQPGVIIAQKIKETPQAAYLVRQYFAYNLCDRFHTQPFLTDVEKRWISFQLLSALMQCHAQGVRHGDLKAENVCCTSWNWIFLVDFAFYKPTFLPADNPADYSHYFDTGHRRRCYLACERFFDKQKDQLSYKLNSGRNDGQAVTEAMDIFSAGCVIAEIFLEGEAIFDLSQVLSYRGIGDKDQKYDPLKVISKIQNAEVRALVQHMIDIDPNSRLSAREYLDQWSERVGGDAKNEHKQGQDAADQPRLFPSYFVFLYHFFAKLLSPELASPDLKIQTIKQSEALILREICGIEEPVTVSTAPKPRSADDAASTSTPKETLSDFITRLESPAEMAKLKEEKKDLGKAKSEQDSSVATAQQKKQKQPITKNCEGLVVVIQAICACIQNVRYPLTKLTALELLDSFGKYVDDTTRLGRILPYCVVMLSDRSAGVQTTALKILTKILTYVQSISAADAQIFPEYIFPALASFTSVKSDELVRIAYAQCIVVLAETARKFLDLGQFLKTTNDGSYDSDLAVLQDMVLKIVVEMLSHDAGSKVKRALLANVTPLCVFLGRKRVNDEILPHLITVLNDPDWELRSTFFEHITGVSVFIGRVACQNFILPCLEQTLFDAEELVIHRSLRVLVSLIEIGLFEKKITLATVTRVVPLLCHPSTWLRSQAIDLIVCVSKSLGPARSFGFLQPLLKPVCSTAGFVIGSAKDLAYCLKPPLARVQFNELLRECDVDVPVERKVTSEQVSTLDMLLSDDVTGKVTKGETKDLSLNTLDADLLQVMREYAEKVASSIQMQAFYTEEAAHANTRMDTIIERPSGSMHQVPAELHAYKHLDQSVPVFAIAVDKTYTAPESKKTLSQHQQNYYKNKNADATHEWEENMKRMVRASPHDDVMNSAAELLLTRLQPELPAVEGKTRTHKVQQVDAVPEYINRALRIPPIPPSLGGLQNDTLSTAPFYKNFHNFADGDDLSADSARHLSGNPTSWRPRGILVATLSEHTSAVNKLSVSRDNVFMASASDDGTVKIWDCKRLVQSAHIRRAQATYMQGGRVNDMTICDSSHAVACVSDNKSIHVFKVEHANSSVGLSEVKKFDDSTEEIRCVEHFNTLTESMLVYGTKRAIVKGWDMRSKQDAFQLKLDPRLGVGVLTTMCVGPSPHCLSIGTSTGHVVVWDTRFQIPVQIWRYSSKSSIRYLQAIETSSIVGASEPLAHRTYPTHPALGPLLFVAAEGENTMSAFDICTGENRFVMKVTPGPKSDAAKVMRGSSHNKWKAVKDSADGKSSITDSSPKKSSPNSVRVTPLSNPVLHSCFRPDGSINVSPFGNTFVSQLQESVRAISSNDSHSMTGLLLCHDHFVVTAGTDRVVRYWDLQDYEDSYWVSGYPSHSKGLNYQTDLKYRRRLENNTLVFEEMTNSSVSNVGYEAKFNSNYAYAEKVQTTGSIHGLTEPSTMHTDTILDMKAIEYPNNFIVTAARDGEIRVFG